MKIMVVCQHFFPEQFRVSDVCFELARMGHEVSVLTGLPNYPSGVIDKEYRGRKKRLETINGVKVYRSWLIARGNHAIKLSLNYISFAIAATFKAFSIQKDFDVVLVYQTSPVTMAIPGIWLKKLSKKPLIIYCHDLWPECVATVGITPNRLRFFYYALLFLSRSIYRQADRIFTSSKKFENYFHDTLKIHNKEIDYLPVYAEDLFESIGHTNHTDASINLVFAGNIGKMQSVETIILAANELQNHKDIKFHLVGDGSARNDCEKLVNELKLDNVIFHGQHPLTEMPKFYQMADAFLVTLKANKAVSYTLPNKVQSYLAAGKPILAAIDGETQEIIQESNCGLCCNAEDFQGLAKNIEKFINEKSLMSTYGDAGRKYYLANFSQEEYFKRLNRLLTDRIYASNPE